MKPTIEVAVLGQGIVGSLISFGLTQRGVSHVVIDRGHQRASSYAAAGIVNPVTGRRFVKTYLAETLQRSLSVYGDLEQLLGISLLRELAVLRDLTANTALNTWELKRLGNLSAYLAKPVDFEEARETYSIDPNIALPERLGRTLQAFRVDMRELITTYRAHLRSRGQLVEEQVEVDDLLDGAGVFHFHSLSAKRVIDCTGAAAMHTQAWGTLPWRGTLGEAYRFHYNDGPRTVAIKQRHFLCPVGTGDEQWVGGTNADQYTEVAPSSVGKTQLDVALTGFAVRPKGEIEHVAAVRPTVRDRRPLLGEHPDRSGLWLCNGMGTKGASLAPYFTNHLLEHIYDGTSLLPEVSLDHRWKQ